jgi:radical SAM superfamily enzyme YgiQ (UPF0313 family)
MGLGYIASYLQRQGMSAVILDCDTEGIFIDYFSPSNSQEINFEKKIEQYKSKPPVVVGIGPCTTPFLPNCLAIARSVKKHLPKSFLVLGGPHVSIVPPVMAERMLSEFPYIDGACVNEGEVTSYDLINALRTKGYVENVAGIVTRTLSGFSYTPRKLLTPAELDSLPYPNRELIAKHSRMYRLAVRRSFARITSNQRLLKKYGKNPLFTPIFSSRGCPYNCTFCCSLHTRRVRTAENVVQEIEACVNNYGIHCFVFYDDLFTTSSARETKRVRDICQRLLSLKVEVYWEVELRADIIVWLGKDLLSLMNKAGCCTVNVGIEKATDSALARLNKRLTVKQVREAIALLNDSGHFVVNGTFMFGGESETKEDIDEIIEFSKCLGIDYAAFYPLEIHPGTVVFEEAKKNGLVDDILTPYVQKDRDYPLFVNSKLAREDLIKLQCKAYQDFYMNAHKIEALISKVGSVYTLHEQYKHFFEHAFTKGVR